VAIVFEGEKMKGVDEAVGGISGDDVDLMIEEGAVEEAEVHDIWLGSEAEIVAGGPAGEAVGTFQEFVAYAYAPF